MNPIRRLVLFLLILCLIYTQTAQAYSLAWLPYKYQHTSTHTETLSTDGFTLKADGTPNDLATRRINNKAESQTQTNRVTTLTSAGDITTHSGGDTLIEASKLNAQGAIDLSATGYAATYNKDGSIKTAGREGIITFAAVKDSTYTSVADSGNSLAWQNSSGGGNYTETLKLANLNAGPSTGLGTGGGLSVNAQGGVVIDIPAVPAPAAPAPQTDALSRIVAPVPLTAEQQAAQRQADFNQAIQNLSSQPGQAWIGQLANDPKVKVQWNQVQTAVQHWDYSHGGLTPEAVAVIAIVVTYCTAGAGSGAVGAAAGTTAQAAAAEYVVTSAVVQAAITTLATQATITLINNKGDLGKTLNDLGQSQNVKALATAMLTAGVLAELGKTISLGDGAQLNTINAKSGFIDQLQKNLIDNATGTVVNHAINGGDLQQQLELSLRNAFIDTGAAQSANLIGDLKQNGTLNDYTHQLAHAIAGCAAGMARAGDCSSGALGAVVGEMSAELYGGNRTNSTNLDLPGLQTDTVNFARMMAGIAAAITGGDAAAINLAASAGGNAAENNYLSHWQQAAYDKEMQACSNSAACKMGASLRWGVTSVKQDAALVTGMALGAGIEVKDAAAALADLPQTIAMLANNPELLKGLPDGYVQGLQTTYNNYQTALESAGVDGATAAGVDFTHLLTQLALLPATVATGGAAAGYTVDKMAVLLDKIGTAAKTADVVDAGIQWGKGIQGQGMPWEDYLASQMSDGSRLPPNFKTFDFYDKATGVATSAKTLDTATPAKIADPSQVYYSLKGNIDTAVNFETTTLSGKTVNPADITARNLQVAVPANTTPAQWEQINKAIQYGQGQGVNVKITVVQP